MLKKTTVARDRMTKKLRATVRLFPLRRRFVAVAEVGDIPVITLTFSDGFEPLPGFYHKTKTVSIRPQQGFYLFLDADLEVSLLGELSQRPIRIRMPRSAE